MPMQGEKGLLAGILRKMGRKAVVGKHMQWGRIFSSLPVFLAAPTQPF